MIDAIFDITPSATRVAYQPLRMSWPRRIVAAVVLTDALGIAFALLLAQFVRFGAEGLDQSVVGTDLDYLRIGLLVGAIWMVALSATRSREVRLFSVGLTEYQRVVNATLWTFGGMAIIALLAQIDIARGYLLVALPVGMTLLLLGRLLWRRLLIRLRRAGRAMTGAIVAGPLTDVRQVVAQLRSTLKTGYRAIAVALTDDDDEDDAVLAGISRVRMDDLVTITRTTRTRAVMIAGNLPGGREQIRTLGWDLENSATELILVSRLIDVAGPRMQLRPVEGLPMVHVDLPQYTGFTHGMKRALDISVASLALAALTPVLLAVAIAVATTSPGPVLFRQERVGQRGTRFEMLKFRSMVVGAHAMVDDLAASSDGNGVLFKMHEDPRVTRAGRVLRRYSLDELPQLINVLRGEMSLVGPRPPLLREVEQYEGRAHRRLLTKPGLTGPWQVGGRSSLSWEESVKLDLSYVENWSITGDLLILLRTVRAVLRKEGAY